MGSTAISNRLGDVAFHAFLNDVFFDLAGPVAAHRGTVYRYVGDMIIVTWPADLDRAADRAVQCSLDMERTLVARRDKYSARYGTSPELRFVLHAGAVVAGEMGHLRREIVYLGTTLNAAARLERLASARQCQMLASERIVDELRDHSGVTPRRMMRAAETDLPEVGDLYTLAPAGAAPQRARATR